MPSLASALVALLAATVPGALRPPRAQAPQPAPELQRFAPLVGSWRGSGEVWL